MAQNSSERTELFDIKTKWLISFNTSKGEVKFDGMGDTIFSVGKDGKGIGSGDGFVGPQGEYYPGHPTVEQLKILYGK